MSTFSTKVLNWYHQHGRILPWRGEKDPYKVLVSEIMLQQTRVDTVIPYYEKWIKRFPSLEALAGSSEQEVLATWEGLGYYSRARNLYRAARMIMDEYGGEFPNDVDMLQRLPGIGKYTARAVASMAFRADTATLDANIRRVLSRYFALYN